MYLNLFNSDNNATPKVFHDGVDVTGLRAVGEKVRRRKSDGEDPTEKIQRRRSDGEDLMEKVQRRRSVGEGLLEKVRRRRGLTPEPTMALISCEMREEKKDFFLLNE